MGRTPLAAFFNIPRVEMMLNSGIWASVRSMEKKEMTLS
jgi:hypothetical protein